MNITKPSDNLISLARAYLSIVDSNLDGDSQTRTAAHNALMDALEAEGIPFNSRVEARWIARWLVQNCNTLTFDSQPRVMWAEPNPYNHRAVKRIYADPPDDNRVGLVPVLVVLIPFENQDASYERTVI